jgi:hypothetical protein
MMNCRARNIGWRVDYFVASEKLRPALARGDPVLIDNPSGPGRSGDYQMIGPDSCEILQKVADARFEGKRSVLQVVEARQPHDARQVFHAGIALEQ